MIPREPLFAATFAYRCCGTIADQLHHKTLQKIVKLKRSECCDTNPPLPIIPMMMSGYHVTSGPVFRHRLVVPRVCRSDRRTSVVTLSLVRTKRAT